MSAKQLTRTTPQLYRDCLRLIRHIAGNSAKATNLQRIVGSEFRKNAQVTDPVAIDGMKSNAIRALANYLMIESTSKDEKLQKFSAAFAKKEAGSLNPNRGTSRSDG